MSEVENAEVISEKTETRSLAVPSVKQIDVILLTDDYVRLVEKQIELRQKLLMTAIKATKKHDWIDFGGKPYLEGEGASRIMAAVRGFKVGEALFQEEKLGDHYFIDCLMQIEWMGQSTVSQGDCSTVDKFFTGAEGDAGILAKEEKRTGSKEIAARLIRGDARKKARENALSRGVTELMGLKGLTWDDLKELGYGAEQAGAKVEFKTGSQGGKTGNLKIVEALQATVGSIINVQGKIANVTERKVKTKNGDSPITDYLLIEPDNNATIKVSCWGTKLPGAEKDKWLHCEKVSVTEYQNRLQFSAKEVSVVEIETIAPQSDPLVKPKAEQIDIGQ